METERTHKRHIASTRLGLLRKMKTEFKRIDAHHHFWLYTPTEYPWIDGSMEVIKRDFKPSDLRPLLEEAGLDGVISVQARQVLDETRWLLDLADQHDFLRGVVGWAPIADENFLSTLDEFRGRPKLKGLRHVIQDELYDDYILRSDFNRGIRALQGTGLIYDILILPRHLPQAIRFVDQHPHQVFVLDHLAKPPIIRGGLEPWAKHLRELGLRENVFCKLSGLITEADWISRPSGFADSGLIPYLDVAVETFKPSRLMAGSDWPVCLLGAEYISWFNTLERYFSNFSRQEQEAVFGRNATYVYKL